MSRASVWCYSCRRDVRLTAKGRTSRGGVMQLRGRCPGCRVTIRSIVGKVAA